MSYLYHPKNEKGDGGKHTADWKGKVHHSPTIVERLPGYKPTENVGEKGNQAKTTEGKERYKTCGKMLICLCTGKGSNLSCVMYNLSLSPYFHFLTSQLVISQYRD